MKKIIIITFSVIFFVGLRCFMSNHNRVQNEILIAKGDAIERVLCAIGANRSVADSYDGSSYEIIPIVDGGESSVRRGFLYCAVVEHLIQPEEVGIYQYKLYPENNITFYELCQLMSSCLQDKELSHMTSYMYCVSNGIIKFNDTIFWKMGNAYVSEKEFEIMLSRFLNCKRYRYFVYEHTDYGHSLNGYWKLYKDNYNAMTYNEYFSSEQYKLDREYAPTE